MRDATRAYSLPFEPIAPSFIHDGALIGATWTHALDEAHFPVIDPATGTA